MFLTTLLQQRKYRSNFSVFSAKAKTFPQCGKIFGALFMTLIKTHNTDGISRVRETGRNQSALIRISRSGFTAKNKIVLIFIKSFDVMHSKLLIFYNKSIEYRISKIYLRKFFISHQYTICYMLTYLLYC
jgi:hypothetical protein